MPIYTYTCLNCENVREELQPIGAEAPTCCGKPMFRDFAQIAYFTMGKMPPSLRKLDHGSVPFTAGQMDERKYRDRRAATDYKRKI